MFPSETIGKAAGCETKDSIGLDEKKQKLANEGQGQRLSSEEY